MVLYLYIDFTSETKATGFDHDKEDHIGITPPCSMINAELVPEVQSCCKVLDGIFSRSNLPEIMSLMKYSLDLSNPWISQYFHNFTDHGSTLLD